MSRSLVQLVLVGTVLLAAGAGPLLADTGYEHYVAAEEALEKGEWRQAVEQLNSALEKKGDSGVRVRTYGMKLTAYFPYLKLGIAYYELGQLDAASQAFETEEQLGAIAGSDEDMGELRRYRGLVTDARQAARAAEEARIKGIVRDGIVRAREFESQGRLEEAIGEIGNVLAVSPDESEALAMLSGLRAALTRRQVEAEVDRRVSAFVDQGREHLAAGQLAEAASVLRQALELEENPGARDLLDRAQAGLREELERGEESERVQTIAITIADVLDLESAGRIPEALNRLQDVLALDSSNDEAVEIEKRLLAAREEAGKEEQRRKTIDELLVAADTALEGGDPGAALAAANQVLGLEAANSRALETVAAAYQILNRRLLGGAPRQNVPPAISFVDLRQALEDGSLAQFVQRPDYQLNGLVIDESSVEIEFFVAQDEPIHGEQQSRILGDLHVTDFWIARDLEPGSNLLRIVARDEQGLSSSSEYRVVYKRPFIRSPWFKGLVATLLVLVFGSVMGWRRHRRRQLHSRRFNPYMAGSPVLDERLFFGRERLLDRIMQTLHNNSLLLHGERRIGKTSLQHQLKKRLEALEDPDFEFLPVFVDLQGTPEERFFATLAEEIFEELAEVLDGLEPAVSLAGEYTYRDFVKDLRQVLRRLRGRSRKHVRLVLLIDEVDELNSYDPRVNQRLRSLFMKSFAENLVAVVSGVSIKREWDREGSPWYNFFEEIDVGPFEPEDARDLVVQPVQGVIKLEEAAVARILELTECRPYRIQKLCMRLVNRMYEEGGRQISVADVDAIGESTETMVG